MDRIIRDRGTKKWTAMMLPEHVKELREWYAEDQYVGKPVFEDWELELIQEEIEVGVKSGNLVLVSIWRAGKTIVFQGTIDYLDVELRRIVLKTLRGMEFVAVDELVGIQNIDC